MISVFPLTCDEMSGHMMMMGCLDLAAQWCWFSDLVEDTCVPFTAGAQQDNGVGCKCCVQI